MFLLLNGSCGLTSDPPIRSLTQWPSSMIGSVIRLIFKTMESRSIVIDLQSPKKYKIVILLLVFFLNKKNNGINLSRTKSWVSWMLQPGKKTPRIMQRGARGKGWEDNVEGDTRRRESRRRKGRRKVREEEVRRGRREGVTKRNGRQKEFFKPR